jgi:hypothetical protein
MGDDPLLLDLFNMWQLFIICIAQTSFKRPPILEDDFADRMLSLKTVYTVFFALYIFIEIISNIY